eukprot:gnl/MRDRNA2_/MRDRNA2_101608_c0_seq1.p1 gnl/MRDRNA2_/MRDRNA2_101608_c0~~gnl/MRDRNA2_/MRDRNA2_101608_c0_seq1.p1  ORF type:complete len:410 (-),score=66.03 gnl/MRDRNA2_/MRDRNA2_101608_c0_seq1:85-1152(-)
MTQATLMNATLLTAHGVRGIAAKPKLTDTLQTLACCCAFIKTLVQDNKNGMSQIENPADQPHWKNVKQVKGVRASIPVLNGKKKKNSYSNRVRKIAKDEVVEVINGGIDTQGWFQIPAKGKKKGGWVNYRNAKTKKADFIIIQGELETVTRCVTPTSGGRKIGGGLQWPEYQNLRTYNCKQYTEPWNQPAGFKRFKEPSEFEKSELTKDGKIQKLEPSDGELEPWPYPCKDKRQDTHGWNRGRSYAPVNCLTDAQDEDASGAFREAGAQQKYQCLDLSGIRVPKEYTSESDSATNEQTKLALQVLELKRYVAEPRTIRVWGRPEQKNYTTNDALMISSDEELQTQVSKVKNYFTE